MLIRELFHKADVENVFNAYILIRPVFDDLYRHTIQEKAMAITKLRKYIKEACKIKTAHIWQMSAVKAVI